VASNLSGTQRVGRFRFSSWGADGWGRTADFNHGRTGTSMANFHIVFGAINSTGVQGEFTNGSGRVSISSVLPAPDRIAIYTHSQNTYGVSVLVNWKVSAI